MRILDLYCGCGGASVGYAQAFPNAEIWGVDKVPQPNYPFHFVQMDVVEWCKNNDLSEFDFIHASPPCQTFSVATPKKAKTAHADMVGITRQILQESGKIFCMENVPLAPMRCDLWLTGEMFNLPIIRKRIFEFNAHILVMQPSAPLRKGSLKTGEIVTVAGMSYANRDKHNFKGKLKGMEELTMLETRKYAMGIDWVQGKGKKSMQEINNAVPPAYAKYIMQNIILTNLTQTF